MKKILCILLASALVVIPTMTAFAAPDLTGPVLVEDNYGVTTLPSEREMNNNYGILENVAKYSWVHNEYGIVKNNQGRIDNVYGIVQVNDTSGVIISGSATTNKGKITTNKGVVNSNTGTIDTNKSTIKVNEGTVTTNNGTITDQSGKLDTNNKTVTTNNGNIDINAKNGVVTTNNGTVDDNYGTVTVNTGEVGMFHFDDGHGPSGNHGKVITNDGIVWINFENAIVENNNGTDTGKGVIGIVNNRGIVKNNNADIMQNNGVVEINSITSTVTMANNEDAEVIKNYGTVELAKMEDGVLVFAQAPDPDAGTYYGLTYNDNNGESNTSVKEGATIKIIKGATKTGYNFVKWTVATNEGERDFFYYGDEEIEATNPLFLTAIYEQIQSPQPPTPTPQPTILEIKNGAVYTSTPANNGSASSPINGEWKSVNGKWQFVSGGTTIQNGLAWITYNGKPEQFYFDKAGNMMTGWQLINGDWYYFDTTTGVMLKNGVTPDNYTVNADGKYVA